MMKNQFSDASYEEIISQLFVRFPSFQSNGASAYKPGLGNSFEICRRMGEPQKAYPCIHVAGTNGKGSTCNMLTAQLVARGLKVGLYTSPHILDFRERMRVVSADGVRLPSREKIWNLIREFDADFTELGLSFFEITTALAFRFFADERIDIAVIETGLGGRLDATNVITPILSAITNIGLDHTDLLGSTLPEIAAEKAGIIKPGVPVVIGESQPDTDPVFIRVAAENDSPITFAGRSECKEILARMDLRGSYQEKNLGTVMAAMGVLGLEIDWKAIENAARICDFHGRWEVVREEPYTICDIGHNRHGLQYNFAQLETLLDEGRYTDLVMVYGSVADKDVDAVLEILPQRAHIIFTAADNHRAMPAQTVLEHAKAVFSRLGATLDAEVVADVPSAVDRATELCRAKARPLLYIGGSTYVVSEAVKSINSDKI